MGTSVRCVSSRESGYEFRVLGPGGILEQATFFLRWEPPVEGVRTVVMEVTDYLTTRETLAYVIPIGPKLASATWSLKKFSASMQAALR